MVDKVLSLLTVLVLVDVVLSPLVIRRPQQQGPLLPLIIKLVSRTAIMRIRAAIT